jgi:surface protein
MVSPAPETTPFRVFASTNELCEAVDEHLEAENPETMSVSVTCGYPVGTWDVSHTNDFSDAFNADPIDNGRNQAASCFNEDLSQWDVSSASTVHQMFRRAEAFNQDLSMWDVSSVVNMSHMFFSACAFNQDLSLWDASQMADMSRMFSGAGAFNQDLSIWNTASVTGMSFMFACQLRNGLVCTFPVRAAGHRKCSPNSGRSFTISILVSH